MASFLQFEHRTAVEEWLPAAGSERSCDRRYVPAPVPSPKGSTELSLSSTLAALKRFFTERDDARAWPSAFGGRPDARFIPGVGGTQGRDVAVPPSGAKMPGPVEPSHGNTIWGSWQ